MNLIDLINDEINLFNNEITPENKKEILKNIKNKIIKEYKNKDFIKSSIYLSKKYLDNFQKKYTEINKKKKIVDDLMKLELPEQRTNEWFIQRKKVLTASSLAAACDKDHFKKKEELIYEKISTEEKPFVSNPITEWGVKYEEIATKFYESLNNLKVLEFGMIPHPDFTIFGASPDGICSNDSPPEFIGRMLEIKCPPKRKFTKTVPEHYKMQVLGQLECCNLEECDFLQVKIEEYNDFEDYKKDLYLDVDETIKPGINNLHLPKGATVTYKLTNDSNKLNYIYPELFLSNQELDEWLKEKKQWILNKNYVFVESKYWKITRYECTLVKRDKKWWLDTCELILNFWKDVEYYKNNLNELLKKIETNKKKKQKIFNIQDIDECLID
tara:strand:- start:110 stop:1264 length:1155 start_codon:yes stop_codon:yes gene_type:complete